MMGGLNALPLSGNVASPAIHRRVSFDAAAGLATSAHAADTDKAVDAIKTASPIKHLIIIVGENRSFDHLFATYVPRSKDEKVRNLSSEGIVNAGGTWPGLINSRSWLPPNGGKYFISVDKSQKALYNMLPLLGERSANSTRGRRPQSSGRRNRPKISSCSAPAVPACRSMKARIFASPMSTRCLRDRLDDRTDVAVDVYTGDTIHQVFQTYQQMDCAIDSEHVTPRLAACTTCNLGCMGISVKEGPGKMKVVACLGIVFAFAGCMTAQERQQHMAVAIAQRHKEKTPGGWMRCLNEPGNGHCRERDIVDGVQPARATNAMTGAGAAL
jgi:hypothetical protein